MEYLHPASDSMEFKLQIPTQKTSIKSLDSRPSRILTTLGCWSSCDQNRVIQLNFDLSTICYFFSINEQLNFANFDPKFGFQTFSLKKSILEGQDKAQTTDKA